MIKTKWVALVSAWQAMATAAGFRYEDRKAAAGLTTILLAAYLVAGLLALIGNAAPDPEARLGRPAALLSVEDLNNYYRPTEPQDLHVPPLFLGAFPADYRDIADIADYKNRFVQIVLPLVLIENRRVRRQRARLLGILARAQADIALRPSQQDFLRDLTVLYRAAGRAPESLISQVDAVPPSLALAQAAEESFWGRSRFARDGNALFGQWTYDASIGLVPQERSASTGHLVRKFASLRASVRAYIINLNTHPAYADFRAHRARMRASGQGLNGYELARSLREYSQRGDDYTVSLRSIIRVNRFAVYDSARLRP